MSRLGKSLKSKFLAMVLAGAMVMSSVTSPVMLVSAAESADAEAAEDAQTWSQTNDDSEEAAEDEEVKQKDTEEVETEEQDNKKPEAESGTTSKKESTTAKEDIDTEDVETEESETDSEDAEESQSDAVDNKAASIEDAKLAEGHKNAKWYFDGIIASDAGSNKTDINSSKGTYKNGSEDFLYIDATTGKFAPDKDKKYRIQVTVVTKIYIPVITDDEGKAKIRIYQDSIVNKDTLSNSDNTSLEISKDGKTLSSEVECTAFTSKRLIELTITLSENKNAKATICVEVKGTSGKSIYITKIVSGEDVRDDDLYDKSKEDSKDFAKYNMEGYAGDYGVTGGGIMKTDAANY